MLFRSVFGEEREEADAGLRALLAKHGVEVVEVNGSFALIVGRVEQFEVADSETVEPYVMAAPSPVPSMELIPRAPRPYSRNS